MAENPIFAGAHCAKAGPARPLSAATGRWRGNGMYSLKSVGDIGLAPPSFFNSGFVRYGVGNGVRGPVFPLPVTSSTSTWLSVGAFWPYCCCGRLTRAAPGLRIV